MTPSQANAMADVLEVVIRATLSPVTTRLQIVEREVASLSSTALLDSQQRATIARMQAAIEIRVAEHVTIFVDALSADGVGPEGIATAIEWLGQHNRRMLSEQRAHLVAAVLSAEAQKALTPSVTSGG